MNMIHYTYPLTSADSASAHTELSCSTAASEEINSHGGRAVCSETDNHGSSLEEINSFWANLLESSMQNDTSVCGGSLASSQQIKHGMRDSGNKIVNTNTAGSAIFVPPLNVTSETHATNPGINQVPASYFGALKHHRDQSHSLLTSDLDSESEQFVSSLVKTPVHGNIPNDVPTRQNSLGLCKYLDDGNPCLGDNPNSAIQSFHPVTNKRLFSITEISPELAYSTENTKATTKINVVVDKLPQFHYCKDVNPEGGTVHMGTIHIGSERLIR